MCVRRNQMGKNLFRKALVALCAAWMLLAAAGCADNSDGNESMTYTVTFNSNGGSSVASQTVKSGEKAVEPKDPERTGYSFNEWQLSGKKFDFNQTITADITLTAAWTKNNGNEDVTYTVTFDSNGGSTVAPQTVKSGEKAVEPKDPKRTGYSFNGWQLSGEKFDFNQTITADITLTAAWTKNNGNEDEENPGGNTDDGNQEPEEGNQDGYLTIKGGVVIKCDPAAEGYLMIPPYVTAIGENAFDGCSRLKVIEMQDGVTEIREKAFRGCTSLNSIEIPASVTSIDDSAFEYCIELATVNFRGTAAQIAALELDTKGIKTQFTVVMCNYGNVNAGRCYFEDCLTISDNGELEGCNTTVKGYVIIPNSVRSIYSSAFKNCTELLGVVIPTSVSSYISFTTFEDASKISEISYMGTIADWTKIIEIGERFYSVYESGKLYIDGKRVNEITEITENDLSGVLTIKNFRWWSNLRSVSIPNSVTNIGSMAFYNCTSLTQITMHSATPPKFEGDVFDEVTAYMYVPSGSKDAYITALGSYNSGITVVEQ